MRLPVCHKCRRWDQRWFQIYSRIRRWSWNLVPGADSPTLLEAQGWNSEIRRGSLPRDRRIDCWNGKRIAPNNSIQSVQLDWFKWNQSLLGGSAFCLFFPCIQWIWCHCKLFQLSWPPIFGNLEKTLPPVGDCRGEKRALPNCCFSQKNWGIRCPSSTPLKANTSVLWDRYLIDCFSLTLP